MFSVRMCLLVSKFISMFSVFFNSMLLVYCAFARIIMYSLQRIHISFVRCVTDLELYLCLVC